MRETGNATEHLMQQIRQTLSSLIINPDQHSNGSHIYSKRLVARLAWKSAETLFDSKYQHSDFGDIYASTFDWRKVRQYLTWQFTRSMQHLQLPDEVITEKVEQAINNLLTLFSGYPYNQLTTHNFYYFNEKQPGFLLLVDSNGYAVPYDLDTSLTGPALYHAKLSGNGFLAKDVEGALDGINEECRYLLEIDLPLNCEFSYWQQQTRGDARNQAEYGIYRYRGLKVSHYREAERYDLFKLTDIKKLTLRGLFKEFPDTWSDNKLNIATWFAKLTEKGYNPTDYDKAALWDLLGIEKIPQVRFKPRNPTTNT